MITRHLEEKAKDLEWTLQRAFKKDRIQLSSTPVIRSKTTSKIQFLTSIPLQKLVDKGLTRFVILKKITTAGIIAHTVESIIVNIQYVPALNKMKKLFLYQSKKRML